MRLDGLKNDLPETPDFIHNMIQEEVARQTKITNMVPMKKRHKYKWTCCSCCVNLYNGNICGSLCRNQAVLHVFGA